ncbi:hypothetical protein AB0E88_25455 [Streptomyces sp. NPDC028635]|uniref:hypothetical protein n=1 Tax=Streptomyces sp. NPDC028635 TaxID=3154800 RepID=UPI0033FEC7EB
MRHKIAALAATTVMLGCASLATATSASATVDPPGGGWDHTYTTSDAKHGGTVYVSEYGDVISLCDTAADGLAPRADIFSEESIAGLYDLQYSLTASGGEGSCVTSRASQGGVHDLPEGRHISITVWLGPDRKSQTTHNYLNDN